MTTKIKFPFVIDISSWKGTINWDNVAPRPSLVICQASNGLKDWDDLFPGHWKSLKRRYIKRGAYHVFDPEEDSHLQVNNYLEAVDHAGGFDEDCLPPILDASNFSCNSKKKHIEKKIRNCLEDMQYYTGTKPIFYISKKCWTFLRDKDGYYPDWANDYLLWFPWYPSDPHIYKHPPINTFPNGWENWAIWKYDEVATISGIQGYVSLSTLSDWYASQLGISLDESTYYNQDRKHIRIKATIVSAQGAIIRRQSHTNSKMLAFLSEGSRIIGESIQFVSRYEAWLQVIEPVVGWCPIVIAGNTYLSINSD